MFRRREKLVFIPVEGRGMPGMVPADNSSQQPHAYPDFFDTLWYVRRLKEWSLSNDAQSDPPVLYWLSTSSRERMHTDKGKRDVSTWLAVFTATVRCLEDVERELQDGACYSAASWMTLKRACQKLWIGLDVWLPTGE